MNDNIDDGIVTLNSSIHEFQDSVDSLDSSLRVIADEKILSKFSHLLDSQIDAVKHAVNETDLILAKADQVEFLRTLSVFGSLGLSLIVALFALVFCRCADKSSLWWTLVAIACWLGALVMALSAGAHLSASTACADFCPFAVNASVGGSVTLSGNPVVNDLQLCNEPQLFLPLELAVNQTASAFEQGLKKAQMDMNETAIAEFQRKLRDAHSASNIVADFATCSPVRRLFGKLAPLVCDEAMVNGFMLTCCAALVSILFTLGCCGATRVARFHRAQYRKFVDFDEYESIRDADEPYVFGSSRDAASALDEYESQNYGSIAPSRSRGTPKNIFGR